jgi:hypothetical protein
MAGEQEPTPTKPTPTKPSPAPDPEPPALTVADLVERYLADARRRLAPITYRVARDFARSFADAHGRLPAAAVRPHHVGEWVARPGFRTTRASA